MLREGAVHSDRSFRGGDALGRALDGPHLALSDRSAVALEIDEADDRVADLETARHGQGAAAALSHRRHGTHRCGGGGHRVRRRRSIGLLQLGRRLLLRRRGLRWRMVRRRVVRVMMSASLLRLGPSPVVAGRRAAQRDPARVRQIDAATDSMLLFVVDDLEDLYQFASVQLGGHLAQLDRRADRGVVHDDLVGARRVHGRVRDRRRVLPPRSLRLLRLLRLQLNHRRLLHHHLRVLLVVLRRHLLHVWRRLSKRRWVLRPKPAGVDAGGVAMHRHHAVGTVLHIGDVGALGVGPNGLWLCLWIFVLGDVQTLIVDLHAALLLGLLVPAQPTHATEEEQATCHTDEDDNADADRSHLDLVHAADNAERRLVGSGLEVGRCRLGLGLRRHARRTAVGCPDRRPDRRGGARGGLRVTRWQHRRDASHLEAASGHRVDKWDRREGRDDVRPEICRGRDGRSGRIHRLSIRDGDVGVHLDGALRDDHRHE
mmetsp:Transcript_71181/g.206465  ORF Transcript_71181/g.206465 Transcript_71181/m.206465 type:complete len:486 (-) Transcript_71181:1906-3363(-)